MGPDADFKDFFSQPSPPERRTAAAAKKGFLRSRHSLDPKTKPPAAAPLPDLPQFASGDKRKRSLFLERFRNIEYAELTNIFLALCGLTMAPTVVYIIGHPRKPAPKPAVFDTDKKAPPVQVRNDVLDGGRIEAPGGLLGHDVEFVTPPATEAAPAADAGEPAPQGEVSPAKPAAWKDSLASAARAGAAAAAKHASAGQPSPKFVAAMLSDGPSVNAASSAQTSAFLAKALQSPSSRGFHLSPKMESSISRVESAPDYKGTPGGALLATTEGTTPRSGKGGLPAGGAGAGSNTPPAGYAKAAKSVVDSIMWDGLGLAMNTQAPGAPGMASGGGEGGRPTQGGKADTSPGANTNTDSASRPNQQASLGPTASKGSSSNNSSSPMMPPMGGGGGGGGGGDSGGGGGGSGGSGSAPAVSGAPVTNSNGSTLGFDASGLQSRIDAGGIVTDGAGNVFVNGPSGPTAIPAAQFAATGAQNSNEVTALPGGKVQGADGRTFNQQGVEVQNPGTTPGG